MILKTTKKHMFQFTILLLIITLSSCAMPTINRAAQTELENMEVNYSKSSLTLEWEYDMTTPVDYFNLYYRDHNSSYWTLLESTESTLAEFTLSYNQIGNGSWDFGVTSVALDGAESDIHSSLDTTALSDTGRYITWTIH